MASKGDHATEGCGLIAELDGLQNVDSGTLNPSRESYKVPDSNAGRASIGVVGLDVSPRRYATAGTAL